MKTHWGTDLLYKNQQSRTAVFVWQIETATIIGGVLSMKKCHKFALLLGIVSAVVAIATAVTAILLYLDKKKKDEEELEHYLDCSIQ